MNYGIAAEFDTPAILLSNSDGIFRSLVDADGEETAKRFKSFLRRNLIYIFINQSINIFIG